MLGMAYNLFKHSAHRVKKRNVVKFDKNKNELMKVCTWSNAFETVLKTFDLFVFVFWLLIFLISTCIHKNLNYSFHPYYDSPYMFGLPFFPSLQIPIFKNNVQAALFSSRTPDSICLNK